MALNGMKKVEIKGIYEPIFKMRLSPAAPRAVTPKKPPIIKIIKGDKAFPASSGRETIEPRKAAKTTYIKRLTKTNNKVLSEKASPIWFKIPDCAKIGRSLKRRMAASPPTT